MSCIFDDEIEIIEPSNKRNNFLQFQLLRCLGNNDILFLAFLVVECISQRPSAKVVDFRMHLHESIDVFWSKPHVLLIYCSINIQIDRKNFINIIEVAHLIIAVLIETWWVQGLNRRERIFICFYDFEIRAQMNLNLLIMNL